VPMNFELTQAQRALQTLARGAARQRMKPFARAGDEDEIFPAETLRQAAAWRFGGISIKDDVGGSALSRLDAALIFEELAPGCTSTAAYLPIHAMAAWMIDALRVCGATAAISAEALRQHFASYCLTESGSGSDAASLSTRAARKGDTYVIDVSGGGVSDLCVCMGAPASPDPRALLASWWKPRTLVWRPREEARLRVAAHRRGHVRRLPCAGTKSHREEGQALGDRRRIRSGQRRSATPWRLRVPARSFNRAGLAGRAGSPDPGRAPTRSCA
jgi:alkylation response protein AidB-like acyl-CoA dehydrogenase